MKMSDVEKANNKEFQFERPTVKISRVFAKCFHVCLVYIYIKTILAESNEDGQMKIPHEYLVD